MKTDRTGTNIYGIVDGAEKIGLKADALHGSPEEFYKSVNSGEIRLPVIAHMLNEKGLLHFVVVRKLCANSVVIGDPAKGTRRVLLDSFFNAWTGYVVTFEKNEAFSCKTDTKRTFRFFSLLKGQHKKLAVVFVFSIIIAIIGIAGTYVFRIVIDGFYEKTEEAAGEHVHHVEHEEDIEHEDDETESESALEIWLNKAVEDLSKADFNAVFIGLITLYLFHGVLEYSRGRLIISVSKKIDLRLSLAYYFHIFDLPVSSISTYRTGEYLSRFSDASTIRDAVSGATVTILLDSVLAIFGGYLLYLSSKKLFLISLGIILVYAAIVLLFRKPLEKRNRRTMEENAQLQAHFKEHLDGAETIKAAVAEEQTKTETGSLFQKFIDAVVKSTTLSLGQDTLVKTVELVGTALILWAGFDLTLHNRISIGELITFYALMAYFTDPIKNLIELQPMIQTAVVAADRLSDVLEMKAECLEGEDDELGTVEQLKFENVSFRYGNRELTLKDISFEAKRGEAIAFVGESGSGKTTIAKLLLNFYEAESGEITINGERMQRIARASLRRRVAYLDQNTFLFSGTVKENLMLGNEGVSDDEIKRICEAAQIDGFIKELPWGYDTPIGENGMFLSGGQRQRLAIARALLRKPDVLIMDEATSHLDTVTEDMIKQNLNGFADDMIMIIIAHRLSAIKDCDRSYVIDSGSVVESGTHRELLDKKGRYAALFNE